MGRVIGTHHSVSKGFELCPRNCLNEQLLLGMRFFDIVYGYRNGEFYSLSNLFKGTLKEIFDEFLSVLSVDDNTIFVRLTSRTDKCITELLEKYADSIVSVSSSSLQPHRRRGKIFLYTETDNPCTFYIHSSPPQGKDIVCIDISCDDLNNPKILKQMDNMSVFIILTDYKPGKILVR